MPSVLFFDDDPALLRANRIYFERRRFQVYTAETLLQAEHLLMRHRVDCIVLDILMPGTDGWDVCQRLKSQGAPPIIFLTSLTQKDCLFRGFELGADDYLTKPYEFKELELRILARIRAASGQQTPASLLEYGPLRISCATRQVFVRGEPVGLTAYEFDILLLRAQEPEKLFTLEEIYRRVWRLPDLGSTQTVRVHLARMRHKLEDACPDIAFIGLVWGKGFLFQPPKKEETR